MIRKLLLAKYLGDLIYESEELRLFESWMHRINRADEFTQTVSESEYHKTVRYLVPQWMGGKMYFIKHEQTFNFTPISLGGTR